MALNIVITEELKREGWIRELTRNINRLRKNEGLTHHDQAAFTIATDSASLKSTIDEFKLELQKSIVGTITLADSSEGEEVKIDGATVVVNIKKL
mgnify:CR=1 FL=1